MRLIATQACLYLGTHCPEGQIVEMEDREGKLALASGRFAVAPEPDLEPTTDPAAVDPAAAPVEAVPEAAPEAAEPEAEPAAEQD